MRAARPEVSFEFFPPKSDDGFAGLLRTADALAKYKPDFFSVTYGAGGSTRQGTFRTVETLRRHGHNAIPHLSWGEESSRQICDLLGRYQDLGVSRLVLIRGDVPSGAYAPTHYASELVQLVHARFRDTFRTYVAAYAEMHPQAPGPSEDLRRLKQKLDAGASAAITQYFYVLEAYRRLVLEARATGIVKPIVAGIMPITNYERLVRFSDSCGAEIPRWIRCRLTELADHDQALRDFGAQVVTDLCSRLVEEGAPGLHFYTLNRWRATARILDGLALEMDRKGSSAKGAAT